MSTIAITTITITAVVFRRLVFASTILVGCHLGEQANQVDGIGFTLTGERVTLEIGPCPLTDESEQRPMIGGWLAHHRLIQRKKRESSAVCSCITTYCNGMTKRVFAESSNYLRKKNHLRRLIAGLQSIPRARNRFP